MRLRRHRNDEQPTSEATRSRIEAEADLARVKARTEWARNLSRSLIEIQRRNHLGEHAASILGGADD